MSRHFEWDAAKAETNLEKHGVSFQEAATVFEDPLNDTSIDPDHSETEDRFITIGYSDRNRLIIVAHAQRADASVLSVRDS